MPGLDKKDLKEFTDSDVRRLFRWVTEELLERHRDPTGILEDEISEAMLIVYGEQAPYAIEILEVSR